MRWRWSRTFVVACAKKTCELPVYYNTIRHFSKVQLKLCRSSPLPSWDAQLCRHSLKTLPQSPLPRPRWFKTHRCVVIGLAATCQNQGNVFKISSGAGPDPNAGKTFCRPAVGAGFPGYCPITHCTAVGCIANNDEFDYRREVEHLEGWCRENNLRINAKKTKEMIVDFTPPAHRRDSGGSGLQLQVPGSTHL